MPKEKNGILRNLPTHKTIVTHTKIAWTEMKIHYQVKNYTREQTKIELMPILQYCSLVRIIHSLTHRQSLILR